MIVAHRKPLEQIAELIGRRSPVLVLGCGGCTSVCLAGGQREAEALGRELQEWIGQRGGELRVSVLTIERQCNEQFFAEVDRRVRDTGALLSLACGAGVQFAADRYPRLPVLPALDTDFVGIDRDVGWYEENCRTCGDCLLGETGGICPLTRCAKGLMNGPCGGTRADGACEVDSATSCAWLEIYRRLKEQDRLALIEKQRPVRDWRNQTRRRLIHEAYAARYRK